MSICKRRDPNRKKIAVVVMGDVDRSPRMINHALSVANLTKDYHADLIGYRGNVREAATVPLAWSKDGLPIGIQFVARFGDHWSCRAQ